ncbi:hypothetical protein TSYNTROPHJE_18470 [Tepidanaerobacter syntrophicus]|nr:hypothetical protein TSYNTROPHJE_18470 [Tepidanaerobacter syntrophicus]
MIYKNIKEARFINRPNRFIANIEIEGKSQLCHVKTQAGARSCLHQAQKFLSRSRITLSVRQNMILYRYIKVICW